MGNEYDQYFREFHAPQSTALHSTYTRWSPNFVRAHYHGLILNFGSFTKTYSRNGNAIRVQFPSNNMFHSIIARAIDGYWALERSLELCKAYGIYRKLQVHQKSLCW